MFGQERSLADFSGKVLSAGSHIRKRAETVRPLRVGVVHKKPMLAMKRLLCFRRTQVLVIMNVASE